MNHHTQSSTPRDTSKRDAADSIQVTQTIMSSLIEDLEEHAPDFAHIDKLKEWRALLGEAHTKMLEAAQSANNVASEVISVELLKKFSKEAEQFARDHQREIYQLDNDTGAMMFLSKDEAQHPTETSEFKNLRAQYNAFAAPAGHAKSVLKSLKHAGIPIANGFSNNL
jgi:hypothetical protein